MSSPNETTTTTTTTAAARTALTTSLSNLIDNTLQPRASDLHSASQSISRQEEKVKAATADLAVQREKLQREADRATVKVKELGDVQNWAEVLEREFLVLEEVVRLVEEGKDD